VLESATNEFNSLASSEEDEAAREELRSQLYEVVSPLHSALWSSEEVKREVEDRLRKVKADEKYLPTAKNFATFFDQGGTWNEVLELDEELEKLVDLVEPRDDTTTDFAPLPFAKVVKSLPPEVEEEDVPSYKLKPIEEGVEEVEEEDVPSYKLKPTEGVEEVEEEDVPSYRPSLESIEEGVEEENDVPEKQSVSSLVPKGGGLAPKVKYALLTSPVTRLGILPPSSARM